MDRRKALKHIGLLSGGIVMLPSCDFSKENVSRAMNKLKVTETQETLLEELVDAIIPATEIPGARELKVTDFVWVMVDDCVEKEVQNAFMSGLDRFKDEFKRVNGMSFDASVQNDRVRGLEILAQGESEATRNADRDVATLVELAKAFAILGFNKSEYIMSEVMPYTLVPGKNPECRPVNPNERINTNA